MGKGWSFRALSECTTLPKSIHGHQPGSCPNLVLWGFMEASLHRHSCLSHWPWMFEFNLQPLSSLWRSGWDCKLQHSSHMTGSTGNHPTPSLVLFQKSPHWHQLTCGLVMNNTTLISLFWLWIDFRKWGLVTKYYNKRCPHGSYHLGNSKGFEHCELETRMKTAYFCYYKSQYHYQQIPSILSSKNTKIQPWFTPSTILIQIPVSTCLIYCNIPHWPP